jgi:hypothetical protein
MASGECQSLPQMRQNKSPAASASRRLTADEDEGLHREHRAEKAGREK